MGITRRALDLLLPRGLIWRFTGEASIMFDGIAESLQRAKDKIDQARYESRPLTALDTLPEWHRAMGIAYDPTLPIDRQRAMLDAILTATGNATPEGLALQISKEYQGLTVGENSGSEYPDDPAGVTYFQPDWATVDGWYSGGNIAVVGGHLRFTKTGASQGATKLVTVLNGNTMRFRVRFVVGSGVPSSYTLAIANTPANPTSIAIPSDGSWVIFDTTATAGAASILLFLGSYASTNTYAIEIDWAYIGTGAYLPNRFNIKGQVERTQDARRVGAIISHFAPLHLVPTVFGYTAATAGNPNPVPPSPNLDDPSIISTNPVARCGVGSCGIARVGKAS